MKLRAIFALFLVLGALPGGAQERGNWRAVSKTAKSITGDLIITDERLSMNFLTFPIAEIRLLKPDEVLAAFDTSDANAGVGHLYRLSIPGDKRFLHKNSLCGTEETQWMATYVSGKGLGIIFFANAFPPVFTTESLQNNVNLCGTFSYTKR
ncbi:hypothetical protein SAMN05421771_0905 [Granulicella pectinivorans]|jgi:hypothetical protein|uniref:Uncharacterized protein n=1 Tax=Granulicella pectinivorans TaxID=474950 RepID=A0A1I6LLT9_9BACT|nr:hypothetical protein [Granulicella pectinivorans]SFS04359.1 hypothetical protein SAMN05421771_0905 [Granulicella pectinivorans]